MAVNFPASLDNFTNPSSNSSVANPSHSQQHSDANDAIEALQAKVGANNSSVVTSHDYKIAQLESLVTSAVAGAKSIYQEVRNNTGSAIDKGTPVYISGTEGASGRLFISVSTNTTEAGSSKTLGLTTSSIADSNNGQIISEGILTNVDTTGAVDGDPVWLGPNGTKIYGLANKPVAPAHLVFLGVVVRGGQQSSGIIFVKIQNGFELNEIHDVLISNKQNNQVLRYDSTSGLWKNQTIDNLFEPAGTVSTHNSATTNVHGIANTADLATKSYANNAASTAVSTHAAVTTNVHGIADTSLLATKSYADSAASSAVAAVINAAPSTLDTLNELAAALANDPNFATTISNSLALKAPLASPTLTGTPTAPTATAGTNTTQIATTAFVKTSSDAAVTTANNYTDQAVTSLGNSAALLYVPISDVGQIDGVASLDSNGFVPQTQLNIDERIQDTAALMITSATHNNITVAYDDNTGRLTFTGIPLTQEQVQDFIAPLFVHAYHTNITASYDDANNRMILEGSGGGGGSGTGGSLTNSWWLGA